MMKSSLQMESSSVEEISTNKAAISQKYCKIRKLLNIKYYF